MIKLTIDSSVFLSALLEKDSFHNASLEFFDALKKSEVTISEPITVLLEVANILIKNGVRDPSRALQSLLQFHILPLDRSMLVDAQFVFQKCRLKTADATVVWCASVSESTLISWDGKLLREAKKLVRAQKPTEYIQ